MPSTQPPLAKAPALQSKPGKTPPGPAAPKVVSHDKPALPPTAGPARVKRRHVALILSFVLMVLLPTLVAGWYLYAVAKDQFASHVGFSVRKEEVGSAVELLGGITELSGSSSSDTDILYEFIGSQKMVELVHNRLDLQSIYQRTGDPIFSLGDDLRIEALHDYWRRMVKVFYDNSSGLIEVRVLAFKAEDATNVSTALFEESSRMINELSAIAKADATRYAEDELQRAMDQLRRARQAIIKFQNRTQIVDPTLDLQSQMGLVTSLQSQLATVTVELQLLRETASSSDPRITAAQRKIAAIEGLIQKERGKVSSTAANGEAAYSELLAEFAGLQVDREFAEKSYISAQAAFDAARAEAQRKSRYLATHIEPTQAQTAQYPKRAVLLATLLGMCFLIWSVLIMTYYSLRDRR